MVENFYQGVAEMTSGLPLWGFSLFVLWVFGFCFSLAVAALIHQDVTNDIIDADDAFDADFVKTSAGQALLIAIEIVVAIAWPIVAIAFLSKIVSDNNQDEN